MDKGGAGTVQQQYDLTQGTILSKLLSMAAPIMAAQLVQMVYNLADMFWMGRVSSDAVAATGMAGMYIWLSMAFLYIGRMGAEIGVSQNLGRQDAETAQRYARTGLFLSVVLGLLFALAMLLFTRLLIGVFRIQEAHVADMAIDYLRIAAIGIPFTFVSAALGGTFTGAGNSRLPFFLTTAGLVLNIILDPIFIFVLEGGVVGAALSTILGQAVVMVLFLVCIKKAPGRPFPVFVFFGRPERTKIMQVFRWSAPIGLESGLFTLLSMLVSRQVAQFGADAIAVQEVGVHLESLSWLVGGGFSSAITAFIGQNFGAGQWERIRRGAQLGFSAMLAWGLLVTGLLFFGGYALTGLFLPVPHLQRMGQTYLSILALCQLPMCLEGVAAGVFRGQGNTVPPSAVSISTNLIRVPLASLLSGLWGLRGIYWAITLTCAARGMILLALHLLSLRHMPKGKDVLIE